MRVCIVSPNPPGRTETFIQAHIDLLPHQNFPIHGPELNFQWKGKSLRDRYDSGNDYPHGRWLNLLPRFAEYRLRQRLYPSLTDAELFTDFLIRENIDVVLAEYGTTAAFLTGSCDAAGVPFVAHFHGFDASRFETLDTFRDRYTKMFAASSSIISVSKTMTESLIELGCPPEKVIQNAYGPSNEYFDVDPDYHSNTMIAVGRHTSKKAPYLTLESFRQALKTVPSLKLVMIGDGELFEVSERLVQAWSLTDKVELAGSIPPEAIRGRMKEAFAFVQHSLQARNGDAEGMPVAILEASAAGLPVISTRHAGIPEAVVNAETGIIVDPGDVVGMGEAMVSLAKDRDKVARYGRNARQRIRRNFSITRHLNVLDQALSEAAAAKQQR